MGVIELLEDRTLLSSVQTVQWSASVPIDEFLSGSDFNLRVVATQNITSTVSFNSIDNPVGPLTAGASTVGISGTLTGTIDGETLQNGFFQAGNSSVNVQFTKVSSGVLDVVITQTGTWSGNLSSGSIGDSFRATLTGRLDLTTKRLTGSNRIVINAPVPGGQIIFNEPVNVPTTLNPSNWEAPNDNLAWIGKRVWYDADGDGVQDDNESGLGGIAVELFAVQGTGPDISVDLTHTDARGYYRFTNLNTGNYLLHFHGLPGGYQFTQKDVGFDFDDSDVDPQGFTDDFYLAPGQNDGTHDAGLVRGTAPAPAIPNITGPESRTTDTTPTISWNMAANAVSYDLLAYDFTAGNPLLPSMLNTSDLSFTPQSAWPISKILVYLRSVNAVGQVSDWHLLYFDIEAQGGNPAPDQPTFIGPMGSTTDTTPTVSWNMAANAASYDLLVYDNSKGRPLLPAMLNTSDLSFTPASAWPASDIRVYLRGVNASGQISLWRTLDFEIEGVEPPDAPVLTGPITETTNARPQFTWNAVDGADTYELVVYHVANGVPVVQETGITGTSFTPGSDFLAGPHAAYVRATNTEGTGNYSSALPFDFLRVFEGETDSGTADDQGNVTLTVNSQAITFEFVNQINGQPLSGLMVAVARDPQNPSQAIVTVVDPFEQMPMQIIVLEGNPAGTTSAAASSGGSRLYSTSSAQASSGPHRITISPKQETIASQVFDKLVTGILPNRPQLETNRNDGFVNALTAAFNELSKAEFLPPPLSGVFPSVIADSGPMEIEDAHAKAREDILRAMVSSQLAAFTVLSVPICLTAPAFCVTDFLTAMRGAGTTVLQHSPLIAYQAAGATHVIRQDIRFGGIILTIYIPEFRNGIDPDFSANLAALLGVSPQELTINATSPDGSPESGAEYDLVSLDTIGLGYRGVGDNAGQDRIFVYPGRLKLHVGGQNAVPFEAVIQMPPTPTTVNPRLVKQEIATIELVSSPAKTTTPFNPGMTVLFSAIARDASGRVIPNTNLTLISNSPNVAGVIPGAASLGNNNFAAVRIGNVQGAARIIAVDENGLRSNAILVSSTGTNDPLVPTILVSPLKVITYEGQPGPGVRVVVQLIGPPPTSNVTVSLMSGDMTEGTVPANVVFTPNDFAAKIFHIKPVDDGVEDGTQNYQVHVLAAASFDTTYNRLNPPDIDVTNLDNSDATFSTISNLQTTEAGGTASFTVRLTSRPQKNVTVTFATTDSTEGVLITANPVFTPDNWQTPQTVTVRGVDDTIDDGDVNYQLITGISSTDPVYAAINPPDITIINIDDDETVVPPGNTKGLWRGPASQCNPLSCLNYTMTVNVINATPQYTPVITGTVSDGSNLRNFIGSVNQSTGRLVINVTAGSFFRVWQMVGTVTPTRMKGDIFIQDIYGGTTTGEFNLPRLTGLSSSFENISATSGTTTVSQEELLSAASEATEMWAGNGLSDDAARKLENIEYRVTDLPGQYLGATDGNVIYIDRDAAGYGWFVESTSLGISSEDGRNVFDSANLNTAANQFDLLTVVAHELGHVLGLEHEAGDSHLMSESLHPGVRRMVTLDELFMPSPFDELNIELDVLN
jgi:hypothetical protein